MFYCRLLQSFRKLKYVEYSRTYSKLSYIHNVGKEPFQCITLGNLLELMAKKYEDREVIISRHQNRRLTYRDLLNEADKLAAGLQTIGLEYSDRVGLWAPNLIEWQIISMACARAGFILVAINPAYQASEIEYCINKVGIKTLIFPDKIKKFNFYEIMDHVAPTLKESEPGKINCSKIPTLKSIITISKETLPGTYNFDEVLKFSNDTSIRKIGQNQHLVKPMNPFNIQFTSGTTGQPKATVLNHFNIINNAREIGKRNELDKKHHKICVQVPFFHAFGYIITFCTAVSFGATVVLPSSTYNPVENLKAIEEEKCTIIHGTPTMYVDLVNIQKTARANINPEIAVSGGAPCSPELFKQMKKILNVKKVKSVYGLTETTSVVFQSLPTDEDEYKSTETVGYVGEHLEVKVVDKQGNLVPFGTIGELCVRGYTTMSGYWNDELRTKEVIDNNWWLKTGDQFVLQEDGYGKVVGRLKDMIIRGGENIFPKEIEDFLNTHPDILETHVIGLAHERLGEEVCACIRVANGARLTLESIAEFCTGKIAKFKIPTQLKVVETFPKTQSGKIQKYQLKKQFENINVPT